MIWILLAIGGLYVLSQSKNPVTGQSSLSDAVSSITSLVKPRPKIYQLTDSDIRNIASHYHDGSNNFEVDGKSLAEWMYLSIQTLSNQAYTLDKYCQGLTPPAGITPGKITTLGSEGTQIAGTIEQTITGTALKATSAIPVIGTILSIGSLVFGFISAHHAAAVQKENQILCALLPQLNASWAYINSQMVSGAWDGPTVLANVQGLQTQAHSVISQDSSSGALHAVGEEVDAIVEAYSLIVQKSGI